MLCFFSWHSSCTAVPQKMSRILSWRSSCTAEPQETNTKFFVTPRFSVSLSLLTCVVLVPLEDRSKHLGQFLERVFIHAIHPPKEPPPIDVRSVLLPVQAPRLINSLTWLGKQAMNDDRCDYYCAQHEHDGSFCFHPLENSLAIERRSGALPRSRRRHRTSGAPRFLRSVLSQPISRLPLLLSATRGTAYDALTSSLFAGVTQIWKSLKKMKSNGSKSQGPQ